MMGLHILCFFFYVCPLAMQKPTRLKNHEESTLENQRLQFLCWPLEWVLNSESHVKMSFNFAAEKKQVYTLVQTPWCLQLTCSAMITVYISAVHILLRTEVVHDWVCPLWSVSVCLLQAGTHLAGHQVRIIGWLRAAWVSVFTLKRVEKEKLDFNLTLVQFWKCLPFGKVKQKH